MARVAAAEFSQVRRRSPQETRETAAERGKLMSPDVEELVRRALAGDSAASDCLARYYRPAVRAIVFMRTAHWDEVEDLTQEILLKAWIKLPALKNPSLFVPWLKTIAVNACRDWQRRHQQWHESLDFDWDQAPIIDPQPQPLAVLLAKEDQRALRAALLELPPANRMALLLQVWGGYSYEEIASFTAVKVSAVEGRIHRAKRQLRRQLQGSSAKILRVSRKEWSAADSEGELER